MHTLSRFFIFTLLVAGNCLLFAAPASAQLYGPGFASVSTDAFVSAGNLGSNGGIPLWANDYQSSATGQLVTATGSQSFTGMDSNGITQTMMQSGQAMASAGYDTFHTSATSTIVNPYYNASNPTYYTGGNSPNNAGSPQYLEAAGQAIAQDMLDITSSDFVDIATIRYVFHIDGNVTDDQHAYAYLTFSAGPYSTAFFTSPGVSTADWATPDWPVTTTNLIPLSLNFGAVVLVNTDYYNTPEGQTVDATADFSDTLALTGIQLLDANGNQVNGATYLTASGTHYNVLGATYGAGAVPEPGSVALFASLATVGAAWSLKRRRSRR